MSWQAICLGVAVASSMVSSLASGAIAQEHVKWNGDDGSVDLMLGADYDNTVITVEREQLGSIFGPGEKPFEGQKITVLTLNSGPKGGISGPINAFRPIWEELSGAKLEIASVPITDLYAEMMLDLNEGEGLYDGMIVSAFFYGDLIAGNHLAPIDAFRQSGKYPAWAYDQMPESLQNLHGWNGVGYGVLNDADGQVLYYRRDILTDPKWQADFKAQTGQDMVVPPKTWQQLLAMSKFFAGKNWDDHDSKNDYGTVLHLKAGEQAHYHFQSFSAPFAITPGEQVDQYHNVYWFDPTNMKPLINSPGHVEALELLQDLHATGPDAQLGWSLGETWDYFLRGKAVFMFSWGDVGPLCQEENRSRIKGVCASAILPSSDMYWDHANKDWVKTDDPQSVGNTTGGSWHGVISARSENPDTTYSFLALMALKPVSIWNAQHGWTGVDPGYIYQFPAPEGEVSVDDYVDVGWNKDDVIDYTKAYRDNFNADTMLTYLRIEGAPEYWDIMDRNLAAAMSGTKEAQQALDDTAASWQEITDRFGRERLLKQYQDAIGFGD